jgi:hypothetical protein
MLRVGALIVITGLSFALVLGSFFAVIGGALIACGGIVLAIAMESVLAEDKRDVDVTATRTKPGSGTLAA